MLGQLVSEDNDMLAHLGTLIVISLYLGQGPAWLACFVSLFSLSVGQGHSGFSLTSNGLQFLLSFAVFMFAVHQVARLADRVRFEAWRSKQRAQLLGWLQEFSQSCSLETTSSGVSQLLPQFIHNRFQLVLAPHASTENSTHRLSDGSGFHLRFQEETTEPEKEFWREVVSELTRLAETSLARIEQTQVQEKAAILEATQSLQSTLINSLSHDLQTPLASVLGAFEMLLESDHALAQEPRRQLIEIGHSQTNRLLSLVRNVINLAKLEGGGILLEQTSVELHEIVEAALERFDRRLSERVEVSSENLGEAVTFGDRTLLTQIVFNLLDNALKFSPSEKPVLVSISAAHTQVHLCVTDFGYGIQPEELGKIFGRFYRGSTPKNVPGSGLGLHICRGLLELHGAKLSVESQVGQGSTFTIQFPQFQDTRLSH